MLKPPELHRVPSPLANLQRAIQGLATAYNKAALRQVLADYPGLLQPSLDSFLTKRLQEAWRRREKAGVCIFLACRAFLTHCRNQGVEAILARPLVLPLPRGSPLGQLLLSTNEQADLPRRVELARWALADVRRASEPDLWATLQRELADCLAQSEGPDRAERLEEALDSYRAALEVWDNPPYVRSPKWAQTLHAMAATFRRRVKGERADNFKQALYLYEKALTVRTEKERPDEWAETQHDLGATWLRMPVGDKLENVQKAIECYKAALTVRTRQKRLDLWAETTHDLAIAYSEHPGGDRAQNLEKAIELCHTVLTVLEVCSPTRNSRIWGRSQMLLGNAYVMRLQGGRTENLEQAIYHYEKSLEALSHEAYPAQWARTHYNLAIAYRHRPDGDRTDDLDRAINHFQQALKVYTPEAYPMDWAHAQTGLGNVYCQPEVGQRVHSLEQAITCYQKALTVRTRDNDPHGWATVQNNLGNAYADRVLGERADNQEKAIACYQDALQVRTREAAQARWAETMNNLGAVYSERVLGNRTENLARAIQYFKMALEVATPETLPVDARRAARNLGNLHFEEEHWAQAHAAYDTAIRAAEILYRASYSPGGKEAELAENTALYQRMVQACLEEPDYTAALVAAEGGKARTFLDQMGQAAFPPPPDLPLDLLQREEKAIEELRGQEQDLAALSGQGAGADREREPSREREIVEQRQETLAALEAVWDEMARDYPDARSYVAARRGEPMTWDDIHALARHLGPDAALVEFYTLPDEIVVFVLRAGWEVPRVHRVPLNRQGLYYRYLLPYQDEVRNHESGRTLTHDWLRLGEHLLTPLEPLLEDAALVYFVPHDLLHYLPLHALTVVGEPFIARRAVAYAPSAAVLARTLESATAAGSSALVMGYTDKKEERTLFEGEARALAARLHTSPWLGRKADAEALCQHGPGAWIIHLSCHGQFRGDAPAASCVYLASGEFTTHDWMALPLRADLVTLSACETGISDVKPGDDLTGLTRALLYAGASSALVTLWSVRADTTLDWMLDFYERTWDTQGNKKMEEALAFQQATLDLRKEYPDPYYWAPFTLVGDWR